MAELELDDDERAALIDLLAGAIENDLFPQSQRIQRLRGILGKVRTPAPNADEPDQVRAIDAGNLDIDGAEQTGLALRDAAEPGNAVRRKRRR